MLVYGSTLQLTSDRVLLTVDANGAFVPSADRSQASLVIRSHAGKTGTVSYGDVVVFEARWSGRPSVRPGVHRSDPHVAQAERGTGRGGLPEQGTMALFPTISPSNSRFASAIVATYRLVSGPTAPPPEPTPTPAPTPTPEPTPQPSSGGGVSPDQQFGPSEEHEMPLIGEIKMFAGDYAPRGWALCDGQTLAINQYSSLFSVLGTRYGGNGQTTFALPDLRGRVPMHAGNGPGLTHRALGDLGGAESVTLTTAQLPPHSHALNAADASGDADSPAGNALGRMPTGSSVSPPYSTDAPNVSMESGSIGSAGGGQSVPTVPPFGTLNYIICVNGIFPTRN